MRKNIVNVSRRAEKDLDRRQHSRTNTLSAREHTVLAPPELLRNRGQQRLSNQGDVGTSVTWKARTVNYTGDAAHAFISYRSTWLLFRMHFERYTVYKYLHSCIRDYFLFLGSNILKKTLFSNCNTHILVSMLITIDVFCSSCLFVDRA
jgi:hypothetical protein